MRFVEQNTILIQNTKEKITRIFLLETWKLLKAIHLRETEIPEHLFSFYVYLVI